MKSILITLLLSIALLALSSCKKSNPVSTPTTQQQTFPLAIGNTWLTLYTIYDTTGSMMGTISDTARVASDTVVSGETWYFISSQVSKGPIYYANEANGVWELTLGSSSPTLLYKYPANVGDTWSVQGSGFSFNQGSLHSNNASITVPKGTYACYDYRMLENSQLIEEAYFYAGVGVVQLDSYSSTNSGRSYLRVHGELVSSSLK